MKRNIDICRRCPYLHIWTISTRSPDGKLYVCDRSLHDAFHYDKMTLEHFHRQDTPIDGCEMELEYLISEWSEA